MKITESLVSIVLASHNSESTLGKCLESLLAQSYTNLEILVIDDFSKDETAKIVRRFKQNDARIRFYRNKKRYGPAVSFNRGLKRAKGQYIAFMNANDSISPLKIKKQVNFLLSEPKVVAVGTQVNNYFSKRIRTKSSYPLEHEQIYQKMLHGIPMKFESALINRSLLPKDLLKFTTNAYPFIYSKVFLQMLQYGKLANLDQALYNHATLEKSAYKLQKKTTFAFNFAGMMIQSFYDHDYRPSLKALAETGLKSIKEVNLPRILPLPRSA